MLCRCFLFGALLLVIAGSRAVAQQTAGPGQDASELWKIANFVIFAVGLGWIIARYGPRFFNARSADIQKAIKDATGLKMDADLRYSEIDKKIAALAEEIKRLRGQNALQMEELHGNILRETEQQIQHIDETAAVEIEALRGEAMQRARRQTAHRSLSLAEQRLEELLADSEPDYLFHEFLKTLHRGVN
ncbi:MAG: ATP synthase F0 subunit B [Acidobacteriaceae bacterium]|nr:ATP synthase F0 subunit B [Acidobacteriaceae bacterium]